MQLFLFLRVLYDSQCGGLSQSGWSLPCSHLFTYLPGTLIEDSRDQGQGQIILKKAIALKVEIYDRFWICRFPGITQWVARAECPHSKVKSDFKDEF